MELSTTEKHEITELWRMSKAYKVTRFDRLHWVTKKFIQQHPDCDTSYTGVYKQVDNQTRQGI